MPPLPRLRMHLAVLLARLHTEDDGFSTAELLANAALGVITLVIIWGVLQQLGINVLDMISSELLSS